MLSYQHQFHAGNHADVLKHWLLVESVLYFQKKDKPFDFIDTHAGNGLYRLNAKEAQKTGESAEGILKLMETAIDGMSAYRELVAPFIQKQRYPGSPALVNTLLRPGDHSWLFELHPQAYVELKQHCARKGVCYVRKEDGFKGLVSLLPTQSRRSLVLIDPSYEVKSDYQTVVQVMEQAYKKAPNTSMLLWYPVADRRYNNQLEKAVTRSKLRNVQLFELGVADDETNGMTASGMIIVNPPWVLESQFKEVIPTLSQHLSQDGQARWRFQQLIAE